MELHVLIGAPGAGKSTFAKNMKVENPDIVILNLDSLRAEFGTGEEDQSVNQQAYDAMIYRLYRALEENKSIVVDATNMDRQTRKRFVKIGKKHNATLIAHVLIVPREVLIERNRIRGENGGRNVGEGVIDMMLNKYFPPTLEDGFDKVNFIDNNK